MFKYITTCITFAFLMGAAHTWPDASAGIMQMKLTKFGTQAVRAMRLSTHLYYAITYLIVSQMYWWLI